MWGILVLIVASAVSCAVVRQKEPVPAWTLTQISDPDYFIGIGSAPIRKGSNAHIENARKDALNELASEISVELYSSNVLVTLVRNEKSKEEFSSIIRSRVATDLQGYQLHATYANANQYWVYYRLSKKVYEQQQETNRLNAQEQAGLAYHEALVADDTSNYRQAIIHYARAIDAVRMYLYRPFFVETAHGDVDVVRQSIARITDIVQSLQIVSNRLELHTTYASTIPLSELRFQLQNVQGTAVGHFPVRGYYSESALLHPEKNTDRNGLFQMELPIIRSRKEREHLVLTPDLERLVRDAGVDFLVRRTILNTPVASLTIPIHIRMPSVRIELEPMTSGSSAHQSLLYEAMKNLCLLHGMELSHDNPDFVIYIASNTKIIHRIGEMYTSELNGDIVLTDGSGRIRYTARFPSIKGVHLQAERAAVEAYLRLFTQLESRWFQPMLEAMANR